MQRVLVVDDEPPIRTVLRGYLEAEGFKVGGGGRRRGRARRAARPTRLIWCCST